MTSLYNPSAAAKARKESTCSCRAYPFPHREGSGKCFANESGPFCGHCGQPCEVSMNENGVGFTEFWGSVSFDSRIEAESKCCDAPVFDDAALQINYTGDDE